MLNFIFSIAWFYSLMVRGTGSHMVDHSLNPSSSGLTNALGACGCLLQISTGWRNVGFPCLTGGSFLPLFLSHYLCVSLSFSGKYVYPLVIKKISLLHKLWMCMFYWALPPVWRCSVIATKIVLSCMLASGQIWEQNSVLYLVAFSTSWWNPSYPHISTLWHSQT